VHLILARPLSLLLQPPSILSFIVFFLISTSFLFLEIFLFDFIDCLLSHMLLIVHGVEKDAALLELLLHILSFNHHEVTEKLIFVLINLGCNREYQAE
jgi:hypothetical protein